jgi:hypothetical protein
LAAFDLDPVKKDALAFGSRSYLRLRVTLIDADASFSSSVVPGEDTSDVRVMIANAQVEAFEEELYTEVDFAMSLHGTDRCRSAGRQHTSETLSLNPDPLYSTSTNRN